MNENSQLNKNVNISQIAIDCEAVIALAMTWQGTTAEGAELVVNQVKRFEDRHRAHIHLRNPKLALLSLIDGLPPEGEYMIRQWEKKNDPELYPDPESFIGLFLKEMQPKLYNIALPRLERKYEVDDNVKIRFNGIFAKSSFFCRLL